MGSWPYFVQHATTHHACKSTRAGNFWSQMKHLFLPVLRESYLLIVQNQRRTKCSIVKRATWNNPKTTKKRRELMRFKSMDKQIMISLRLQTCFFCIYVCISVWLWVYSPVLYMPCPGTSIVRVSISLHRCIYLSIYIVDMICVLCELIHVFVRLSICRQPHYVWYGLGIVSFAAFWKVGFGNHSTCMYLRGSVSAYYNRSFSFPTWSFPALSHLIIPPFSFHSDCHVLYHTSFHRPGPKTFAGGVWLVENSKVVFGPISYIGCWSFRFQ